MDKKCVELKTAVLEGAFELLARAEDDSCCDDSMCDKCRRSWYKIMKSTRVLRKHIRDSVMSDIPKSVMLKVLGG